MTQPTHFDPIEVKLQGTNLVEASAGTGKTYSVAILVLRLLVEKGLPLKEMLIVTFTNAAVAELEERIRHFVRQAYYFTETGDDSVDEGIRNVVKNAATANRTLAQIKKDLYDAVLLLDETSILTIHSFCQQTLRECAFETGQLFGAELIEEDSAMLEEAVNQFWRKYIPTLPKDLLRLVLEAGIKKKSMCDLLEKNLGGKSFASYRSTTIYYCSEELTRNWTCEIEVLVEDEKNTRNNLINTVESNWDNIQKVCDSDKKGKSLGEKVGNTEQFLSHIKQYGTSQFIQTNFCSYKKEIDKCKNLKQAIENKVEEIKQYLLCAMIQYCNNLITAHKESKSQISFDDLIIQLHTAICKQENESLPGILRNKYKAVFVDEFQDTDWKQYEIFKKAFQGAPDEDETEAPIVFYIGDPKQSIYGFRSADLDVYFGAGQERGVIQHTMNVNHRSVSSLVHAMNVFFAIQDPFLDSRLQYQKVDPSPRKKDCFFREGSLDKPLTIYKLKANSDIAEEVAKQVWQLLYSGTCYYQAETGKQFLKPADIGILVRKKQEGKSIKLALAKLGIPAVTVDETKILETDEARYLLYWLQACLDPQAGNINRALLSPFTGFTAACLLNRNQDDDARCFRIYQQLLNKNGIYKALLQFIEEFNVRQVAAQAFNGDRTLSNLLQLAEQLHEVQTDKKYTPSELVCWLQRGIESGEHRGEQFQQRLESDEQAVKIITIHKSKGLEYKIVLAPFLDIDVKLSHHWPFYSFKENGRYIVMEYRKLKEDPVRESLYLQQEERENRRLLYVAITRAVHKCILYKAHNENGEPVDSVLLPFFSDCEARGKGLVEVLELPAIDAKKREQAGEIPNMVEPLKADLQLSQKNWCKLSFTYLAAKGHTAGVKNGDEENQGYDDFIFKQLKKGEKTGLMLHSIFEHIDFSNKGSWMPVIEDTLKRYRPTAGDDFKKYLHELVENILTTPVQCNGETVLLSQVDNHHRLSEFEFDFNVQRFNLKDLSALLEAQGVKFKYENQKDLEGVMYGLMDLFFMHKNKFYILDWKSNHLGYTAEDYNEEAVVKAMQQNNYHLQYLIYTLATKKYLKSRLGDAFDFDQHFGGVIYLFVRGIRIKEEYGIFTTKPSVALLEKLEAILNGQQISSVVGIPLETGPMEQLRRKELPALMASDLEQVLRAINSAAQRNGIGMWISNEEVADGKIFYFALSYHAELVVSFKEAIFKGDILDKIGYERGELLLIALEEATEVFPEDLRMSGITLTEYNLLG